jgi:hypothetical protein
MADFTVYIANDDLHSEFEVVTETHTIDPVSGKLVDDIKIDQDVTSTPPLYLISRYQLFNEGGTRATRFQLYGWVFGQTNPKPLESVVYANVNDDVNPTDGYVKIDGYIWAINRGKCTWISSLPDLFIEIGGEQVQVLVRWKILVIIGKYHVLMKMEHMIQRLIQSLH